MKEKFIRILSPVRIAVVALLDASALGYGIFSFIKMIRTPKASIIFFFACVVVALILAVLVTKETFSYGVKFYDDEMEFTGLDGENVFQYSNIEKIETFKDTKASLVKNFVDRQSKIIIYLKDERVITVDIGLSTKGCLKTIEDEINRRISQ